MGVKTVKYVLFGLIVIILISLVFLNGCETDKISNDVIAKPISDYGKIEATVLDLNETSETVIIKVNRILQYNHDERANYPPLKVGDELNVKFQWGVKATKVDLPPIGDGIEDINLLGIKVGDNISAEISNEQNWRVYKYDIV